MSLRRSRIFGWPSPEEEQDEARAKARAAPSGEGGPRAEAVDLQVPASMERRRVRRSRVLLRGKLVFDEGALSSDCIVRDLSVWGARIRLPSEVLLRDEMYLIESQNCIAHESKVVWKNGHDVGLQFIGRRDLDIASAKHFRIMRDMWLELRAR